MDIADPRNIELSVGSKWTAESPEGQQRFRAIDIRSGPTMDPDLAVIVMNGAIDPRQPNTRPAALPTAAMTIEEQFFAVGFSEAPGEATEAAMVVTDCPRDRLSELLAAYPQWYSKNFCAGQGEQEQRAKLCTGGEDIRGQRTGDGGKHFCGV